MSLIVAIKTCLIETHSVLWIRKHLCDIFPIQKALKSGQVYCHCSTSVL